MGGAIKVYMRVTDDQYELPIAVADTHAELARMLGLSRETVKSAYKRARTGRTKDSTYKEVDIDSDDG